jgi:5-methylcytosine-specific restriction endonuclease McrA
VNKLSATQEFGRIHREALREGDYCRACGWEGVDRHHVVYRSLGGTDDKRNLVGLCRWCHQKVHDKKLDLLPLLDLKEQGYAASLIGIERAHRLLAPSVYRKERT